MPLPWRSAAGLNFLRSIIKCGLPMAAIEFAVIKAAGRLTATMRPFCPAPEVDGQPAKGLSRKRPFRLKHFGAVVNAPRIEHEMD
jgi:hypothetical protein